jgi:hypothetical protein
VLGTEQQDLRWEGALVPNAPVREPGSGAPAPCWRNRWTDRYCAGAFYRRLSARIGKTKAVTATARKIAVLFYNAVRHGMEWSVSIPARRSMRHATVLGWSIICIGAKGIRIYPPANGANAWRRRFLGIILEHQLAELGVQRLHVDRRRRGTGAAGPKYIGGSALKLGLPRGDLIGVHNRTGWQAGPEFDRP